ncbi:type II toxin-antitoxin system HicA family toxin [Protofrankia symbiont of Coriaria ruscifolia]|uniref:type II toxin-antitoxin system HicA family toxin n=1 Tax=Protofrankia symbiont of Coriaria ruscifolia TaxID=1306542 RepID=UPI003D6D8A06
MSGLPVLSGARLVKALERAGFTQVRSRGSHVVMRNLDNGRGVTVPLHTTNQAWHARGDSLSSGTTP